MKDYPSSLRTELLKHVLPLAIITLPLFTKEITMKNFSFTFVSIFSIFFSSKFNYVISSILFLLSTLLDSDVLYFMSFGISLCAANIGAILISQIYRKYHLSLLLRMECLSLIASIFFRNYLNYDFLLILPLFFIVYKLELLPIDILVDDKSKFLKEMYKRLTVIYGKNNYIALSMEYKRLVEIIYNRKNTEIRNVFMFILYPINLLLPTILFLNHNVLRIFILLSVFFSFTKNIICSLVFFMLFIFRCYYMAIFLVPFMDWTMPDVYFNRVDVVMYVFIRLTVCLVFMFIKEQLEI